jgi:hypothetical protein
MVSMKSWPSTRRAASEFVKPFEEKRTRKCLWREMAGSRLWAPSGPKIEDRMSGWTFCTCRTPMRFVVQVAPLKPHSKAKISALSGCNIVGLQSCAETLPNSMVMHKPDGGTSLDQAFSCAQNAMQAECISTCFPNFVRSTGCSWDRSGSSVSLGMLTLN